MTKADTRDGPGNRTTSPDRAAEQSLLHTLELARATDALQRAVFERHRAEKVSGVLAGIGERLNKAITPDGAAQVILDAADELFGWDAALVDVYDSDRSMFFGVARFDTIGGKRASITPPIAGVPFTPLRKRLFEEGPLLILRKDDVQLSEERFVSFGSTSRKSASLMFVPINKGERRAGILSVQSYTPEAYDEEDLELLRILADYCCTGLERTFAELRAHEAERTCRLLLSSAPLILYRTDSNLQITTFSIGAGAGPGLKPDQYLGEKLASLVRDSRSIAAHRTALTGQRAQAVVVISKVAFDCIIDPIFDAAGTVTGCEVAGLLTSKNNETH